MSEDAGESPGDEAARAADRGGPRAWARWLLVDEERARLRAPYRLVLHTVAVLLGYVLAAGLVSASGGGATARALAIALQTACIVLATWAAARWLDRRSPVALLGGWDRRALLELLAGALVGASLIASVAAIEHAIGAAHYAPSGRLGSAAPRALAALAFFVSVAIDEELWFRGYQLTNVAEGLERWLGVRAARAAALAVSAVLFGLAHALNPNATALATANIAVGGVLLGVSYAITGRLFIALGLHFAWNTAQCFLDMPVSGQVLYDDLLLERTETGDDVVTGGAFGPEGGLLGLAAMLLGIVLFVIHARLGSRGLAKKLDDAARS